MKLYRTKSAKLAGTSYKEVYNAALRLYRTIKSKSKRRPYIRSRYFNNEKVFLDLFWHHLRHKRMLERMHRLKFFQCAIEVIQKSMIQPAVKVCSGEHLYRFYGVSQEGQEFVIQIKRDVKRKQNFLISIFPKK